MVSGKKSHPQAPAPAPAQADLTKALTSTVISACRLSPAFASQVMDMPSTTSDSIAAAAIAGAKKEAEVVVLVNKIQQGKAAADRHPPAGSKDDSSGEPSTSSRTGLGPSPRRMAKRSTTERLQYRLEARKSTSHQKHAQQDDHRAAPPTSTSRPSAVVEVSSRNNITAAANEGDLARLQKQCWTNTLNSAQRALENFRYPEADQVLNASAGAEFGIKQMTGVLRNVKDIDNAAVKMAAKGKKDKPKEDVDCKKEVKKDKPKEDVDCKKEVKKDKPKEDVDCKKEVEARAQMDATFELLPQEMVTGNVQREREWTRVRQDDEGSAAAACGTSSTTPKMSMASADIGADREPDGCCTPADTDVVGDHEDEEAAEDTIQDEGRSSAACRP